MCAVNTPEIEVIAGIIAGLVVGSLQSEIIRHILITRGEEKIVKSRPSAYYSLLIYWFY